MLAGQYCAQRDEQVGQGKEIIGIYVDVRPDKTFWVYTVQSFDPEEKPPKHFRLGQNVTWDHHQPGFKCTPEQLEHVAKELMKIAIASQL